MKIQWSEEIQRKVDNFPEENEYSWIDEKDDYEQELDMEKVNANGSGIGLGHPTGQTGIRLVISCMYELMKRGGKIGCASLCAGGGPAMAVVIEML